MTASKCMETPRDITILQLQLLRTTRSMLVNDSDVLYSMFVTLSWRCGLGVPSATQTVRSFLLCYVAISLVNNVM